MRRLLLAGMLLQACATAGPARLPDNPGWIGGQRVAVIGPQVVGIGGPELAAEALHEGVADYLRTAGFTVSDGGLDLVIESFERGHVKATVRGGGREIERIDQSGDQLGCISGMWGISASDNANCYASGLVGALIKSQAVARAAGPATQSVARNEPSPGPAAAPSGRVLALKGKLAVLDLKNFTKDLSRENAQYFSDVIRQASLKMEPGLDIMTRENLIVLLQSSGKK